MKTGRSIIIQALVALGAAGTIASAVAVPAVTAAAPSSHARTVAVAQAPDSWYHA